MGNEDDGQSDKATFIAARETTHCKTVSPDTRWEEVICLGDGERVAGSEHKLNWTETEVGFTSLFWFGFWRTVDQPLGWACQVSAPTATSLQSRISILIASKHTGLCKGIISGLELSGRLRILFPWKLPCGDKCGMLSLEISYLKLYTCLRNPGCSSAKITQTFQVKHPVLTVISKQNFRPPQTLETKISRHQSFC